MERVALTIFDAEKERYKKAIALSIKFETIESVEHAKEAKNYAINIGKFVKLVDDTRKESTRDERDEIKRVDDYVKEHIDIKKLEKISKKIMEAVLLFDQEQQRKQNDKQIDSVTDRLEHLKQGMVKSDFVTKPVESIVSTRDNWKYEEIDFSKVNEKYKVTILDHEKIMMDIDAGKREIGGLRVFNEPIAIRR